jgi:hypothetical protein
LISIKKNLGTKFRDLVNLETSEGRQTEEVCPNGGSKLKIHGINLKKAHRSNCSKTFNGLRWQIDT